MTAAWGVGVDRELIRQHSNALDRIAAALALHHPVEVDDDGPLECPVCTVVDEAGERCLVAWPCKTWVALEGAE